MTPRLRSYMAVPRVFSLEHPGCQRREAQLALREEFRVPLWHNCGRTSDRYQAGGMKSG